MRPSPPRRAIKGLAVLGVGLSAVLGHMSWPAAAEAGTPKILAHRGIHQTYDREGLTRDACTATRIHAPTHPFLENTLPSMAAAFAAGADVLELDVHPTTDGEFAVFHDWTLECRTEGTGVTRHHTMAHLKTLDVGWGYTADGGATFPFRGKGVGLMPTLAEVLRAFPDRRFLVNIKSRDPTEGERLVRYLRDRDLPTDERLWVFGHDAPAEGVLRLAPGARVMTRARGKECAWRYLVLGWSGAVPEACRGAMIGVPLNLRHLYWGWPDRFLSRMREADVEVMILGPVRLIGETGAPGFVHVEQLDAVPDAFAGYVLTDNIEVIGPEALRRWPGKRASSQPAASSGPAAVLAPASGVGSGTRAAGP